MDKQSKNVLIIGGIIGIIFFLWMGITINKIISEGKGIYIYNPHKEILKLNIGKDTYTLKPSEKQQIDIKRGEYKVKSVLNKTTILDTNIYISSGITKVGGLINLSGESMYLWTEYYGGNLLNDINKAMGKTEDFNNPFSIIKEGDLQFVVIDTTIIFGNIKEYKKTELVIKKEWYYEIDEDFEETVATDDNNDFVSGKAVPKLFVKDKLLEYWNSRN